jgi:hypothetical protein
LPYNTPQMMTINKLLLIRSCFLYIKSVSFSIHNAQKFFFPWCKWQVMALLF